MDDSINQEQVDAFLNGVSSIVDQAIEDSLGRINERLDALEDKQEKYDRARATVVIPNAKAVEPASIMKPMAYIDGRLVPISGWGARLTLLIADDDLGPSQGGVGENTPRKRVDLEG